MTEISETPFYRCPSTRTLFLGQLQLLWRRERTVILAFLVVFTILASSWQFGDSLILIQSVQILAAAVWGESIWSGEALGNREYLHSLPAPSAVLNLARLASGGAVLILMLLTAELISLFCSNTGLGGSKYWLSHLPGWIKIPPLAGGADGTIHGRWLSIAGAISLVGVYLFVGSLSTAFKNPSRLLIWLIAGTIAVILLSTFIGMDWLTTCLRKVLDGRFGLLRVIVPSHAGRAGGLLFSNSETWTFVIPSAIFSSMMAALSGMAAVFGRSNY